MTPDETVDFLRDLFDGFAVSTRRMFGGYGLYHHGTIFGLWLNGALWLKVDGENAAAFAHEGCPRFSYQSKNRVTVVMSYARVPDRLLDEPDELAVWAEGSYRASLRARK